MSRKRTVSRRKKIVLLIGAAALVSGGAAVMSGTSQASVACDGLATALGNNERFIAGQRAEPDAQSEARIANREAVIEEIKRKQAASGCEVGGGGVEAQPPAEEPPVAEPPAEGDGEEVCAGSTVTVSGEGGAPAASSNEFPAGTTLKVTNLDNNKSTTVEVTSVSGSCVLLNNAAFEQVREPNKFLIRQARIERVG
ncbi:septal ring lytic transglycosylase RlpA family protein [Streptomyces gobiensis]|uniref:septal ring lytic transglycosylase RlpA family protein n=1 Tax=Streptomyces gobiensis TaxID=2875706 RepID=UPI001E570DFA|nr:septal ring lytic transglycosylase RlpA family protein [Streptomyces gobiensis]UGY90307.1 septal ring lytic transglycosylase RlpA family protein [Streptomyces gobiensis]